MPCVSTTALEDTPPSARGPRSTAARGAFGHDDRVSLGERAVEDRGPLPVRDSHPHGDRDRLAGDELVHARGPASRGSPLSRVALLFAVSRPGTAFAGRPRHGA